ncbi:hypothetical protein HYFRA_00011864 [Hymenoscyphus fraxineus]|uniref:Uncharacterized protein n=1 Tax=Hymenoscyphus fraxineus TaxID=746836 RepID=A0A9N9KXB0_9HELO|nr:hypothetical protein HYFRA_00011864 [Hymenoscyphus fraxineus]
MLLLGNFHVLMLIFTNLVMSNPLGQISLTDAAENDDSTPSSINKSYQRGAVDIRGYFCCPVPGHSWVEGNEDDIRGIIATYRHKSAQRVHYPPNGPGLEHDCMPVACRGNSGIWVCNEDPVPRYYDAGTIADYVEAQLDLCKNVTGAPPACGQIFRKGDGMNIYIQGSCE